MANSPSGGSGTGTDSLSDLMSSSGQGSPTRSAVPFLLIALGVLLADRSSKLWAVGYLSVHGATRFHPWFALDQAYNDGIGFGLLPGSASLVGWLTMGIVVGLLVWLLQTPPHRWLLRLGLALIIGGALGNMVDRIVAGQVLDFLSIPLWPRIFNVADVAIRLGVVIALAGAFLPARQDRASQR